MSRQDAPALTPRELPRLMFRIDLFKRRGWTAERAEAWAYALVGRDRDRDDRRSCIECQHLRRDGTCFAAAQGWLYRTARRLEPIQDLLLRCERFEFVTP